jgi:anti-sigma B factor antagonist
MSLKISSRMVGDVLILDLDGRITLGEGSVWLRSSVRDALGEGKRNILLNLSRVNYIDSSGVGELDSAVNTTRNQGGSLRLVGLTRKVHDLLQITKLFLYYDVFGDEKSAIESFSAPPVHCCCPLCGYTSGPPAPSGKFVRWQRQVCRNARCEAEFTAHLLSSETRARVWTVFIQTYKDEYFEIQTGRPFVVKIVGRLDMFSAPTVRKAWEAIPVPRRVLFDLSSTTEIDDAGREALVDLIAKRENDARLVVVLGGLSSEQRSKFPSDSCFCQSRATALSELGDVSDTPPLQVGVLSE